MTNEEIEIGKVWMSGLELLEIRDDITYWRLLVRADVGGTRYRPIRVTSHQLTSQAWLRKVLWLQRNITLKSVSDAEFFLAIKFLKENSNDVTRN